MSLAGSRRAHQVDGRSDIFMLGVVFYELLVGRQPFRADSLNELIEQLTNHEPRSLRQVDECIPKELERICFKALAKRASERHMTASDLADDLRHFLAEQALSQDAFVLLEKVLSAESKTDDSNVERAALAKRKAAT